ncbi:hypothetical protein BB561_003523 [Smittium simulii]|uniref:Uncharacterized protein n=1 Tax=Smittium simulii TaxID=133385 RepID=A0A2T9YKW6_9FUNG|nr:hypothetical protein BB561_003523 [Smittium simulii]
MQQDMQEKFFEAINDLTKKVQFLYIEREQQGAQQAQDMEVLNIECDNPHEKVGAPMVEIESYPNLIEAIPSLETDFFRSLIPEEERKEIIYECPKFLGMNTLLLHLMKQLLRPPIDDYVHRKLKSPNTMIQVNEDLEFCNMMRELLSDVASSITQKKINNLHKLMELPGRHSKRFNNEHGWKEEPLLSAPAECVYHSTSSAYTTQNAIQTSANISNSAQTALSKATRILHQIQDSVQESEFGEAKGFDEEKLYKFQRNKCKATYSGEFKYFLRKEAKFSQVWSSADPASTSIQAENKQGSQQCDNQGDCSSSSKECNRVDKEHNIGVLHPVLYHTKKNKRPLSSPGLQKAQQLCRGEEFQNGIPDSHMQNNQEKGLYNLSVPKERFYAHSDTPEIFIKRKLKQSTIKAYKSEPLKLVTDKDRVVKKNFFIESMKFLNESNLIKVTNNFVGIKSIIDHFKTLGPTNNLNTKELTAKTCWLIAVCGFLRASDIHRVDDERTEILSNSIKLIICAPKEKRKSSPIERLVEIKAHSDEILCPIIAYKIYKQKIANISCPKPHVNNKNLMVSHLFKNTKDFKNPLTARAIGPTIAARTGISTDAILTQANWPSYYMFSSYYKLLNDLYSEIAESALSELN